MKSLLLLPLTLIFIVQFSFAQRSTNRHSLSVAAGSSVPFGDFADWQQEKNAGYADPGISGSLSYGYQLTEILGLRAYVFMQRNSIQSTTMERQLNRAFFANNQPYQNWEVKKNHWLNGAFLAGVTGLFPIPDSKIGMEAKALAGISYTKAPDMIGYSKYEHSYASYEGTYGTAISPGVLLGLEIRYSINPKWGITFSGDYFNSSKISFPDASEVMIVVDDLIVPGLYTPGNSATTPTITGVTGTRKQTVASGLIQLGVRYQL